MLHRAGGVGLGVGGRKSTEIRGQNGARELVGLEAPLPHLLASRALSLLPPRSEHAGSGPASGKDAGPAAESRPLLACQRGLLRPSPQVKPMIWGLMLPFLGLALQGSQKQTEAHFIWFCVFMGPLF